MTTPSPYSGIEPAPPHEPPRQPGEVELGVRRGLRSVSRTFAKATVLVCAIWAAISVGWQLALAIVSAAFMLGGVWALRNPPPGQPHYRITARRDLALGAIGLLVAFLLR